MNISASELDHLTAIDYPFGLYFPGSTTTIGLVLSMYALCKDDWNIQIIDGKAWRAPLSLLFRREGDRKAIVGLLEEQQFTFSNEGFRSILVADWHYKG